MRSERQAKPGRAPDERCGCAFGCAPDGLDWSVAYCINSVSKDKHLICPCRWFSGEFTHLSPPGERAVDRKYGCAVNHGIA